MTPRNSSACLAGPGWTCLWPVFALHLGQIGTNIVRDFLATHLECQPVGDDGEWVVFQHRTASYVGCNAVCPVPCGFGMGHIRTRRPTGGYVTIFATPVLITGPIHSLSLGREDTLTPTPTASEGVLRCRHPAMLSCPGSQCSAINSFCVT